MKLSQLRPGQRVLLCPGSPGAYVGRLLPATVIARGSQAVGRQCPTVIHVDAFAGLHGPQDPGAVSLSAYQVRTMLRPMPGGAA